MKRVAYYKGCLASLSAKELDTSTQALAPRVGLELVEHVLGIFREELENAMALCGCRTVAEIGRERVFGGERVVAAGSEPDDGDVGAIHHSRLFAQIDGHRELLAVGAQIVVLCRRIPGLQRDTRALQQILASPRCDVAHEDVRLAAVGQPVIPEPEFGTLGDVRLDLFRH